MLIHDQGKSGEVKTGRQCQATFARVLSRRSERQSTNRNGETNLFLEGAAASRGAQEAPACQDAPGIPGNSVDILRSPEWVPEGSERPQWPWKVPGGRSMFGLFGILWWVCDQRSVA
eukprot:5850916-Pyramimonas_sp.AAC.1